MTSYPPLLPCCGGMWAHRPTCTVRWGMVNAPRIPEWRRRALEQAAKHGTVAVKDITGSVKL